MIGNSNPWIITPDERFKFENQFRELNPLNGYISGNQAKNLFMKSNLPTHILGKIWSLADYDKDGQMTLHEFCIAMHFIKRKLEGIEVPEILPPSMGAGMVPALSTNVGLINSTTMPINSYNTMPAYNSTAPLQSSMNMPGFPASLTSSSTMVKPMSVSGTAHMNGGGTAVPIAPVPPVTTDEEWSMPQAVRPRYRLQFNQQDRNKRGFINGVEAKAILIQSGLPHQFLAQIWSLADIDKDGNLTCDEFCIAMHLVEQARAGKSLPSSLPSTLLPGYHLQQQRRGSANPTLSGNSTPSHQTTLGNGGPGAMATSAQIEEQKMQVLTGEDERRANYLKGQAELHKRRAILDEQMRHEEENRKANDRAEFERQEKIRLEKERARQVELQRQQEAHMQAERDRERLRLEATERQRMEAATAERGLERDTLSEATGRRGSLQSALATETARSLELRRELDSSRGAVEAHKASIGSMRERRDRLMENTDCLHEELDAARAELARCQREKQNLEHQLQGSGGAGDPVLEQIKTVQALKSSHQDKIKQLDKEIRDLEQTMTKRGQKLATNRNKVKDMEKKVTSRLVADIKRLQTSVCEKKNAAIAILKNKNKDSKSMSFEDETKQSAKHKSVPANNDQNADRFSAFRKIHSNNSVSGQDREFIYYEALYPFDGRQSDELSFKAGETVVVDSRDQMEPGSGWLYGWVENTDRAGLFPEVYVKMIRSEPHIQSSRSSIISVNNEFSTPIGTSTVPHAVAATSAATYKQQRSSSLTNTDIFNNNTTGHTPAIQREPPPQIWAETLYAWSPESSSAQPYRDYPNQLSFEAGRRLLITDMSHDDWLTGELDGRQGWFPRSYVRLVSPPSSFPTQQHSGTTTPTGARSMEDLEHPAQHAPTTTESTAAAPAHVAAPAVVASPVLVAAHSAGLGVCVAMYPYDASVLGDLSVQPGDIIDILEQKQDWWKGFNRSNQQQGLFPSNYVKIAESEETAVTESKNFASNNAQGFPSTTDLFEGSQDMFSSQHSQMSINSLTSSTYSSIADPNYDMNSAASSLQRPATGAAASAKTGYSSPSTPEIAQVMIEFTASSAEQISLQIGQLIHVHDKSASGWWQGEIQQRGQQRRIGWFPGRYVNIISSNQSIKSSEFASGMGGSTTPPSCVTPTPDNQQPMLQPQFQPPQQQQSSNANLNMGSSQVELGDSLPGDYLMTMYSYAAQNVDELTFDKGSVLLLLDKNEPEWWLGRNLSVDASSQEGLFPVNYVRRLQADNHADEDAMRAIMNQPNGGNLANSVLGRPVSWYIDGTMSFNAILTEDEKRRQFYIRELIETEKVYYDDLQEVHQMFYEPIKRSNLLTQEELKSIFINWSDLIPNSYNFYMALKIRKDIAGSQQPIQCIGDILLSNFPNFIVYVRFCSLQNQAIAKLQKKQQQTPKFKDLCEACEATLRCQKMPMTSYFLKPMQRITKYKLLVENILKHTDDNHPDRSDTEEAVAAARSLCESVNEGVRERENSERLEWLQEHVQQLGEHSLLFNSHTNCLGHRKLLHSGSLYKAKSSKELVGFLCNDFLLLAQPQYSTGGSPFVFPLETSSRDKMQFKMYKKPIILNQVMISAGNPTIGQTHSSANNELFTVKEPNYEYVLKALSPNDRDKWVEKLMNASTFYINTENSKRERSMSIRRTAGVGRLIVTVVEAVNLRQGSTRKGEASKADPFCEVSLGNQLHRTKVAPGTVNPRWNSQMQFLIKNIERDSLCLTVYNKDYFAPNDFLGRTEVSVWSVVNEKRTRREPIDKRLKLMEVENGELVVRLDLALFKRA